MDFVTNSILEQKLLRLRTCYIAKVVDTNGITAKIQPLNIIKYTDGTEKIPNQLSNVPVVESARQKVAYDMGTNTISSVRPICEGDLVVCICADRNISAAKRGKMEVPPRGRHSISDSIIIGIL